MLCWFGVHGVRPQSPLVRSSAHLHPSVHVLRIALLYSTKITQNKKQHSPHIPSLTTAEAINQSQFVPLPLAKLNSTLRQPKSYHRGAMACSGCSVRSRRVYRGSDPRTRNWTFGLVQVQPDAPRCLRPGIFSFSLNHHSGGRPCHRLSS